MSSLALQTLYRGEKGSGDLHSSNPFGSCHTYRSGGLSPREYHYVQRHGHWWFDRRDMLTSHTFHKNQFGTSKSPGLSLYNAKGWFSD